MHRLALLSFFLACAGQGRRMQMSTKPVESKAGGQVEVPSAAKALSMLLMNDPEAAWQVTGQNQRLSAARHMRVRSPHRVGTLVASEQTLTDEDRAKAALDEMVESDIPQESQEVNLNVKPYGPAVYPLAGIVGQDAIKTALLLSGVNPKIGGVAIAGSRGTAKSVMARAIHKLLPPIEVIKGSRFNTDPSQPNEIDSFLAAELRESGKSLEDLETEVIPTPFVQMPLDVLEDRMLGSVDVEKSVEKGSPVYDPGLLAAAHRGVLYVDDINLLDESISNLLLDALSTGWVQVEREGLSVRHKFDPIMIATFNPEERELREHLMDRIGTVLSADAEPLNDEERIEAADRVLEFNRDPEGFIEKYQEETETMQTAITFAREYLKGMTVAPEQIKYLVENAIRAGVQGNRGELFAAQVARASAALTGADMVGAEDLKMGVKLAIAPRGTEIAMPMEDEMMMEQPPPPPPPPQQQEQDPNQEEQENEEPPPPEPEQDQSEAAPPVPEEFMFDVEGVILDPDIMKFTNKAKTGNSGQRGMKFSDERGRYVKPIMPKGKVKKLAIDATMRVAAPFQDARRARYAAKEPHGTKKVFLNKEDIRAKLMAKKTGSLVIFVVDASGSMALNRMGAAKGAAISLLIDAYQNRDQVCLINFQGDRSEVVLPPTKSIAMAKSRLETMNAGGGSPFAHALNQAALTGMNSMKTGDVGEVLVICISDYNPNVPIYYADPQEKEEDTRPDKERKDFVKEEVLNTSKMLAVLPGFKVLLLDTGKAFTSTGFGKKIAEAANAKYEPVPQANVQSVTNVAQRALSDMKASK